jgi:hypothetical protein
MSLTDSKGGLSRPGVAHTIVDVFVEVLDRHHAVSVSVGFPGLEALDDGAREDRRLALTAQLVTLPGVLDGVRGRQHGAPAPSEFVLQVDGPVRLGSRHEGPAVAAIEEQDDRPGA